MPEHNKGQICLICECTIEWYRGLYQEAGKYFGSRSVDHSGQETVLAYSRQAWQKEKETTQSDAGSGGGIAALCGRGLSAQIGAHAERGHQTFFYGSEGDLAPDDRHVQPKVVVIGNGGGCHIRQ